MKKKEGMIFMQLMSICMFAIVYIVCMYAFTLYKINSEYEIISDSLIASNLAAFSLQNLDTANMTLPDADNVYETFSRHLKANLYLDENYTPRNPDSYIKSVVEVTSFIIYNVVGNDVTIHTFNPLTSSFSVSTVIDGRDNLRSPKNNVIKRTTIHSEIRLSVLEFFGNDFILTRSEDTGINKK